MAEFIKQKHRALILLLILFVFIPNFVKKSHHYSNEMDEYAWCYSGYYYYLAFIKHDLSSKDWHDFDAYDHPPLAKYLFGAVMHLKGYVVDSLTPKTWWHKYNEDVKNFPSFVKVNSQNTPLDQLVPGRLLSTLMFMGVTYLIYWIGLKLFSPLTALLASLIFATNTLVMKLSVEMVSDGIFLLLLFAGFAVQLLWLENLQKGKKTLGLSLATGALAGLVFVTKINGVLLLGIDGLVKFYLLFSAIRLRDSARVRQIIRDGLLVLLVFTVLAVGLNPSAYSHPWDFYKDMYFARLDRLQLQTSLFFNESLPSWPLKIAKFVPTLFLETDPVFYYIGFPLFAVLFAFGILALPRFVSLKKSGIGLFLFTAGLWFVVTLLHHRMSWNRYLVILLPYIVYFMAMGLDEILSGANYVLPTLRRSSVVAGGIFLFCLCLIRLNEFGNLGYYYQTHKSLYLQSHRDQFDWLQKAYPDVYHHPFHLHYLLKLDLNLGMIDEARRVKQEILRLSQKPQP